MNFDWLLLLALYHVDCPLTADFFYIKIFSCLQCCLCFETDFSLFTFFGYFPSFCSIFFSTICSLY